MRWTWCILVLPLLASAETLQYPGLDRSGKRQSNFHYSYPAHRQCQNSQTLCRRHERHPGTCGEVCTWITGKESANSGAASCYMMMNMGGMGIFMASVLLAYASSLYLAMAPLLVIPVAHGQYVTSRDYQAKINSMETRLSKMEKDMKSTVTRHFLEHGNLSRSQNNHSAILDFHSHALGQIEKTLIDANKTMTQISDGFFDLSNEYGHLKSVLFDTISNSSDPKHHTALSTPHVSTLNYGPYLRLVLIGLAALFASAAAALGLTLGFRFLDMIIYRRRLQRFTNEDGFERFAMRRRQGSTVSMHSCELVTPPPELNAGSSGAQASAAPAKK